MVGSASGKDPFCVIQFIKLPHENATEYVVVPESWIRLFWFGDKSFVREVLVAYPPPESSDSTLNRVIAKEGPENEWAAYRGIIEFKTDSYAYALAWYLTKNLNLPLMPLDYDETGDNAPVAALESSGANRNSLSSSDVSELQLQVPAVEINPPPITDEGFRKAQSVKAADVEYFNDALSSIADYYKPKIIETVHNPADNSDLSSSEDDLKLTIDESFDNQDQNSQISKNPANSDDINARVHEVPNTQSPSCTLFEASNKKPLSSVNPGKQGRMRNSTTPPSSSPIDQDHLPLEQNSAENKQPVENDSDLSLFSSSYPKVTPSVPLFGISDSTGSTGKDTSPNAKKPSNFSNQISLSSELPTATNHKDDSLGTEQQMNDQRGTPNNKNMNINNAKNKKRSRLPDTNPADKYYVVQFKNVANLQRKYTSVRSCWVTAKVEYEVQIACPKDLIDIPPEMFLRPIKIREKWRSYTAVVNYETDSCHDAKCWIERETKLCNTRVKNDIACADTRGSPHKRAATPTADEVPPKKRSITANAAESTQLPEISALSIIANTYFNKKCHQQVQYSLSLLQPEQVSQSYPVTAPQIPSQMQTGYSYLSRFPAQNIHPGFEHQYPPVCGQPNIQHMQTHQSSNRDFQAFKRSNPLNSTDPYLQQNLQNTMHLQSCNLSSQRVSGHNYLPDQKEFSHDHNGQILTSTNMQISSTRNMNDYPISHPPSMGSCHCCNGMAAVAASHDSRRGVTGTAGLPPPLPASRDSRLQPKVSGNSAQQNYYNIASQYALEAPARPAANNQPRLERAAARNIAFDEFKLECLKAFYETANKYTIQYTWNMFHAATYICPQINAAWNVTCDEFEQRLEAFRKAAHENNTHYMGAMNNAITGLCSNINKYFIH